MAELFNTMEKEITSIRVQKRNPQRVNIYLDGDFAFGLSRFTAAWLKPGRRLSQSEIDKLIAEEDLEVALQKALHYLGYRPRSEQEVSKRLIDKGFSESVVATTLERLKEKAYVDDLEFACMWVDNRSTFRPRSHRLLSMELRQKGISDENITKALESLSTPEEELAYQAARNKALKCKSLDWQSFRKKVGSFLARRGFSYAITNPVLKRLWDEIPQAIDGSTNKLKME